MTTFAYLRVSSDLQAKANGCDSQRHAITQWAKAKGVDDSIVWFEDSAISGKSMNRPAWREMMKRVKARESERVVMYDLSRAGRTLKDLIDWAEEMKALGIPVVFLSEGIDMETAIGTLMLGVIGSVAEFLRRLNAEKISAGIQAKLASGQKWGRGRSAKSVNDEEWKALAARVAAGESIAAVARDSKLSRQWLSKRLGRA